MMAVSRRQPVWSDPFGLDSLSLATKYPTSILLQVHGVAVTPVPPPMGGVTIDGQVGSHSEPWDQSHVGGPHGIIHCILKRLIVFWYSSVLSVAEGIVK